MRYWYVMTPACLIRGATNAGESDASSAHSRMIDWRGESPAVIPPATVLSRYEGQLWRSKRGEQDYWESRRVALETHVCFVADRRGTHSLIGSPSSST